MEKNGGAAIRRLRTRLDLPPDLLSDLLARARTGRSIFNPDRRRLQLPLAADEPVVVRLLDVLARAGLLEHRVVGDAVLVHSVAGCAQQAWHTDYDPDRVAHLTHKPLGVLVALEDGARLCTPRTTHHLARGQILLFDGDAVHAGAAYDTPNTRLHLYLDVPSVRRPRDTTWLVDQKKLSCH